ncbi:MAG: 3-isopropylmalate dehydratase large subunit [bacterium]
MEDMTIAEKVLASKAGFQKVSPGQLVTVNPDRVMSHDNAALVIRQFREMGARRVFNPDRIIIILDHRTPAESEKTASAHQSIRQFVREQGIRAFYDIGEGVCHQVMVEKGYVLPGLLILGTDSHTTSYGSLGAVSTGIGATEMAAVWGTGELWLRVPETIKILIRGQFPPGVYPKDLILYLLKILTTRGADYRSVEFYGSAIDKMGVSGRFTLCNMAMEMGAKFAIVPFDKVTERYLLRRGYPVPNKGQNGAFWADKGAHYEKIIEVDASDLEPLVSIPHKPDKVSSLTQVAGTKIDQVVIGSCTNGRLDDLAITAQILRKRRVHNNVRLIVVPASRETYREALKRGYLSTIIEAGGVILNPGCGPCLGAHQGILAAGEKCLATTNRNFKGRMGSTEAEVFLASPAVAAVTSILGEIPDSLNDWIPNRKKDTPIH